MDEAFIALRDYGAIGAWGIIGLALFRYLLTRQDALARRNLEELRRQLREWQRRALRSEITVRAFLRAGHSIPHEQIRAEIRIQEHLDGPFPGGLFPEYEPDEGA